MRIFARTYPDFQKNPQAVDQLPWGHISILLHQTKDQTERDWYINQTIKNGWSRSILEMQIESEFQSMLYLKHYPKNLNRSYQLLKKLKQS